MFRKLLSVRLSTKVLALFGGSVVLELLLTGFPGPCDFSGGLFGSGWESVGVLDEAAFFWFFANLIGIGLALLWLAVAVFANLLGPPSAIDPEPPVS